MKKKTLLDLIEIIEPRGEGEKRFFRLHSRNIKRHPDPAKNGDDVFRAANITPVADNHMLPHEDDRGSVQEVSREKLLKYMDAGVDSHREIEAQLRQNPRALDLIRKSNRRSRGSRLAFRKLNPDDPELVPPKVAATYKESTEIQEAVYKIKGEASSFDKKTQSWDIKKKDYSVKGVSRKHALGKVMKQLQKDFPGYKEHKAEFDEGDK